MTLPKEWARRYGVGRGTEVIVSLEADGSLRILPPPRAGGGGGGSGWRASVRLRGDVEPEAVLRRVISFYIAGADVIEIVFDGYPRPGLVPSVRGLVSAKLLGVEVVEESARRITFQVVGDNAMSAVEAFNRLSRTVEHMLTDIAEGLRRCDQGVLREVPERDDIVDKLFIYVWRQITSVLLGKRMPGEAGVTSYADAGIYMMAAKHIERVGDHASRIAEAAIEEPGECGEDLASAVEALTRLYREAVLYLSRPRPDGVEEVMARVNELRSRLDPRRGRVWESARRIADYCTDILELSLNRASVEELLASRGG